MKSSLQVVVVEDDPDDQYLISKALNRNANPVQLEFIANGMQAVEWLESEPSPICLSESLLMLDLNLPGMSGMEILERLRKQNRFNALTIVVLTTSRFEVEKRRATELGANGFYVKPDDMSELEKLMDYLVDEYGMKESG